MSFLYLLTTHPENGQAGESLQSIERWLANLVPVSRIIGRGRGETEALVWAHGEFGDADYAEGRVNAERTAFHFDGRDRLETNRAWILAARDLFPSNSHVVLVSSSDGDLWELAPFARSADLAGFLRNR